MDLAKEFEVLNACQGHPGILRVDELYQDTNGNFVMVTEYAPCGDLSTYCKKKKENE